MGVAETRQHSSGRSAPHSNSGAKQASTMFSPVHKRVVTGNAPSTPSGIIVTGGPKRLQKVAEDDDNDSLNGSPTENKRPLRQYDRWSVEEEQIFFLKLHTSSALSLLVCFRCIAELLPNKDYNQVRNYYYKLKAQFQKHNPARDVDDLTQREMFQAMNSMWSLWSQNANKGGSKPRLSQRKRLPSNSVKQTRYIQSLQESLEQVFKVKDRKAELQAQKEADRHQVDSNSLLQQEEGEEECGQEVGRDQWMLDQQAVERMCQLDMERWRQREADQRAEQLRIQGRHNSGSSKENSSLASNGQTKGQKGQGCLQLPSATVADKPAGRKQVPTYQEQPSQLQALGCTALLEMPNNKPKKAVEGLLRHLQKKWQKAVSQLGDAFELHLVGLLAGQPGSCLSWKSQGISSALTLGQMQQQLQQSGPFLELSYVWLPAEGQDEVMPTVHDKAILAARAASGYTLVTGIGQAVCQGHQSLEASPRLPFGSPLGDDSQRQAMASSSSSSAPGLSEAFSNLQSQASAPLYVAAAASTGQRSGAGESQTAALPLDVTSSVSGLVTPCRAPQSLPQGVGHAKHDDTPRSKLEQSSAGQDLAWEGTKLLGDADVEIEPRLSQSHPDGMDNAFSTAQETEHGAHAHGQQSFVALLATDEALPHQLPDQCCSQPPDCEPYSAASEEPVLGLPLLGTVVMGLPVSKPIRQTKTRRPSKAKQAKAKQPKAPKAIQGNLAPALGQDRPQHEGDAPAVPDQPQAVMLHQPKAKTSGIGTQKASPGVQAAKATPTAFGAGDISLGSWTVAEQGKRPNSAQGAVDRPAEEPQHSTVQQAQHASQADIPAGSGDMDLTNYFAMLPNEVVPFRDLISPLPVTASALPEQQLGSESPLGTDPLICNEHSLATTDAEEDGEAASPTGSGHVSGSESRPPTEQEIKQMDELDLSMNLGPLLGPGESWIVEDNGHFATLEGKADQSDQAAALSVEAHGNRPFQELFPVRQS
ncbi:hypothetical protein WJX79_006322 [Trebouxia sp. C0005]